MLEFAIKPTLVMSTLTGIATAQVTERISVGPAGVEATNGGEMTDFDRYVSADGRFVVFDSDSNNLVSGDVVGWNEFLRDRQNGVTECIDVNLAGVPAFGGIAAGGLSISSDGHYVAFRSGATDLTAGGTSGEIHVFLRDRWSATTEVISVDSAGVEGNNHSQSPSITPDGRFVSFTSLASNLVPGDTNGTWDVFVRDRQGGITERVSVSTGGTEGDAESGTPSISADGRYVVFMSLADNLVSGDTNGRYDVFLRDRSAGVTQCLSVTSSGSTGDHDSGNGAISADGRFVAFTSSATDLIAGDTNGMADVYVYDVQVGSLDRISMGYGGVEGNFDSAWPSISDDGRFVAFASFATNLIPGGTPFGQRAYVCDRRTSSIELVSTTTGGAIPSNGASTFPSISSAGRFVVFRSSSTDLVPGDTNGLTDVFIHDRSATGFTSLCDPGQDSVIPCPCGNPPTGPGRGCDNSSATGGASLAASGVPYLSMDSLAFTTTGERPTATSVLLQGDGLVPNGTIFGQGVRCAGGQLKRMFVKSAVNGGILAPDFGSGDSTISARSAALGLPLQPGQPYEYLVYYRDPIVLGGCSAVSTFNATQTGFVAFWP